MRAGFSSERLLFTGESLLMFFLEVARVSSLGFKMCFSGSGFGVRVVVCGIGGFAVLPEFAAQRFWTDNLFNLPFTSIKVVTLMPSILQFYL